jgi:hypothetical protein
MAILEHEIKHFELAHRNEPELYRDQFPYTSVPHIRFDGIKVPLRVPDHIWITDTTFRDGQQARPPYTPEQIAHIYTLMHKLGGNNGLIRQSEFFIYSGRDRKALRLCQKCGFEFPEITFWIRADKNDFKLVKELGRKETGILTSVSDTLTDPPSDLYGNSFDICTYFLYGDCCFIRAAGLLIHIRLKFYSYIRKNPDCFSISCPSFFTLSSAVLLDTNKVIEDVATQTIEESSHTMNSSVQDVGKEIAELTRLAEGLQSGTEETEKATQTIHESIKSFSQMSADNRTFVDKLSSDTGKFTV